MRPPTQSRRTAAAASVLLALAFGSGAAGCTADPDSVSAQAKAGDQKGYVSGDGAIETVPAAQRKAPIALSGPTIDGGTLDLTSLRGSVVVLNKWGSWCPPCVAEMPDLKAVADEQAKAKAKVAFVGLNVRESAATGQAYARKVGLPYPSLTDEAGLLELQLQGQALATPTTLVLDDQGRIAARVSGRVSAATLRGLIDDTLAGS